MGLLKVKQRRSLERRSAIIAAAIDVFGTMGVHAATLTDVSKAAGVPLPSLYDYFPDKTRLLASLPEAIFQEFYAYVDPLLDAAPNTRERLRIFYLETLRYMERHPTWAQVFFLEIWPSVLVAEPEVREAVDGYARRVIAIIAHGITTRQIARSNDPHLLMSLLLGSMSHLVAVWRLYGQPYSLVARGEKAIQLLLKTISPTPSR